MLVVSFIWKSEAMGLFPWLVLMRIWLHEKLSKKLLNWLISCVYRLKYFEKWTENSECFFFFKKIWYFDRKRGLSFQNPNNIHYLKGRFCAFIYRKGALSSNFSKWNDIVENNIFIRIGSANLKWTLSYSISVLFLNSSTNHWIIHTKKKQGIDSWARWLVIEPILNMNIS